jgi:protein farnesyltransferase subunit beta
MLYRRLTTRRYLDLPALIAWLSSRQYAPEGGFSGRTNKLVDGCYSHWVGGCWPLIEAALDRQAPLSDASRQAPEPLYSREGLIRYILCCCQASQGGLRDKPETYVLLPRPENGIRATVADSFNRRPDAYHSCYVLAGLSSAQYSNHYHQPAAPFPAPSTLPAYLWTKPTLAHASAGPEEKAAIFNHDDCVGEVHPIFVIPWKLAESTRTFFESKVGL